MGRLRLLGPAFAATWLIAATAWAQSAQIQGRLVDEQGGAIPGAQVSAVDEEKGVIARQTISATDGFFTLPSMLRGRYTVRAELSGFKTSEQRGLVLDPGQVLDLRDLKLTVGGLTETVEVSAGTPIDRNRHESEVLHDLGHPDQRAEPERARLHVAAEDAARRGHQRHRVPARVQQHRRVHGQRAAPEHEQRRARRDAQHRHRRQRRPVHAAEPRRGRASSSCRTRRSTRSSAATPAC